MTDITLKVDNGYFNYRVGAIILDHGCLLMVKNDVEPYYYSVGGRVKFGETADDAVLRETWEETHLRFEIDRLAFVHENFFLSGLRDSKPCHEISLFFLMKPRADLHNMRCDSAGGDGQAESLHWLPISELASYPLFPEFFKTELACLKDGVGHFVTKGEKTFPAK